MTPPGRPPRGRKQDKPPLQRRRQPKEESGPRFNPRVSRRLLPVLSAIGVPEAAPFVPDPFQVQAVETLAQQDVVVSAPTGSGKTWIAEQAIARALASGKRAWYASPLKALSNSKYAEFGQIFGQERVGILTGDRKENLQADLLVGTTEILRNQLYDAMYRGEDLDAGLVVLDEAHFLGDPERGVVWEEVIIYLPPRVRLLLLSATVENADQIARWLHFVRDEPCATIHSDQRPVPLYPLFLAGDGEILPLKASRGGLYPRVAHLLEQDSRVRRPLAHQPPFGQILMALEEADLLPAIFFLKSRADCDAALVYTASARLTVQPRQRRQLTALLDDFLARYPFLQSHPQLTALRTLHVAAHHAGHLPHWKLLVERLMQHGLLKAIFSTSTVAAGVNFPARTVVITQSDRFNGRDFVDLTATDLLQMTGRAGRRGMDKIGFALVVPGPYQNVPLVASLLGSSPDPIESQLSINFSMVLNLLLSQRPAEVKQLLGYSLATFQRLERADGKHTQAGPQQLLKALALELAGSACPGPEEAVIRRKRRRQLENLRRRLQQEMQAISERRGLWAALVRGRVFMDMFGSPAAVLRREGEGEQAGVLAVSLIPDRRLQKGRPRLDFVPLDEVAGVFQEVLDLPHAGGGRVLAQAVLDQLPEKPRPLAAPELDSLGKDERQEAEARLVSVEEELSGLACLQCPLYEACQDPKAALQDLLNQAEAALSRVQEESHAFWYDFVRHLEFLRAEGFADPQGRLTPDGRWASNLRLDQPILIAEAIRQEAMPQDDPVLLAAMLALFVDDRERESESRYLSQRLSDGFVRLRRSLDPMLERLRQWGFETPIMPMPAASAIFAWGLGSEFGDVVVLYGGGEGDLANLIYRTADNLRQVASLHDTHPKLAACAREAVDLMLRPPVVVPT
ncbi:MAG: DEAD/DEAH box helicase [Desulfarculus sp.]|nr:DEAD/DEAH box helicase [Desulfarculus sp.]